MTAFESKPAPLLAGSHAAASRLGKWLVIGVLLLNGLVAGLEMAYLAASHERTVQEVRQTTGNLANLLRDNIAESARGIDLSLIGIVDALEHMDREHRLDDRAVAALLERHRTLHPEVDGFRLFDPQGMGWGGHEIDRAVQVNISNRDYFRAHQARPGQSLTVSEPILSRVSNKWVVVLSRSFRKADGSLGGVINGVVPISHFSTLLSRLDLGPHGSAVIRHDNTALVARFPKVEGPRGLSGDKVVSAEFMAIRNSGVAVGMFHTPNAPDGYERSYAFRRIPNKPLLVAVGMAPQDYLDGWQREVRNGLLLLAAFFALSSGGAWLILRVWRRHMQSVVALETSEARFRAASSITSDLVYSCRRDADGQFRFDWVGGHAEPVFGCSREQLLAMGCWLPFVAKEDAGLFQHGITDLVPGQSSDAVLRIASGEGPLHYVRSVARVEVDTSGAGGHRLFGALQDITERLRQDEKLRYFSEYQDLLQALSFSFISLRPDQTPAALQEALGRVAAFAGADRAYVFRYDFAARTASNTHEWCAPGVAPQIDALQGINLDALPDWVAPHLRGEPIVIADVEALPEGNLRDILTPQEIKSLVALPLISGDRCLGCVGFDAVLERRQYEREELQLLALFANLLAHLQDRQQAEAELEHQRGFLKTLVQTIPDLIWLKDPDGVYLACNPRFESFFGASEADILGKTDHDFVERELADIFRANDQRAIDRGASVVNEEWITFADDGHRELVETTKTPMYDGQGRLVGVLGIAHDITQARALAEEARRESERSRILLRNASDGIHILDRAGNVLEASDSFCAMLGYAREEVIGMNVARWDSHFDAAGLEGVLRLQFENAGRTVFETRHRRKDGREFDVEVSGLPMQLDGNPVLFNSSRDITERRRAEEMLRESEASFRSLFDSVQEAVYVQAEDGSFITVNEGAARMYGHPREWFVGKTPLDVSAPGRNDLAALIPAFSRVMAGEPQSFEFWGLRADGSEFPKEVHQTKGSWLGRIVVFALAQDITERKQSEERLLEYQTHLEQMVEARTHDLSLAKEAAEAANRAKSTFLANMSHELRTPLNGIMGMTSLALRKAQEPQFRDQLGKIDQASRHLLNVINDILDLSKIEAERLTLEVAPFSLGEVLRNIQNLIGPKVAEKSLRLHVKLPPDLVSRSLVGDPLRLGQILLNLFSDAVKFTEKGHITLRVQVQKEGEDDVLLHFQVEDTGIGISQEDQQRLFTAFEQADGSMTRKYGGTGLGLAISKRLARLMGGRIGLESVPGEGSRFWFTARLGKADAQPAVISQVSSEPPEARLRREFPDARILLAEDEPVGQEVAQILLEEAGLLVDLAEDGEQALELARRIRYDAILMDMQMPRVNGVEAARALRADSANRDTPILAMTANAFEEDRQVCLDAGMNDHIPKPIDPDRLYESLWHWMSQGRG